MSHKGFMVAYEIAGVRRYIADGTVPTLWTEDRTRAKVWKLRVWAEKRAAESGGQVWELHRVEAEPARLPRAVLIAELEGVQARVAKLEAALRVARDWAWHWPKGYPRDTVVAAIDAALEEGQRP